jgi:hypothetical protein
MLKEVTLTSHGYLKKIHMMIFQRNDFLQNISKSP